MKTSKKLNFKPVLLKIFLTFLFFFTFSISYCQNDIIIDFEKKTIEPLPELKVGDYYRVVIENINLNIWKVSLNTKDTVLVPKLETPSFASLDASSLSALLSDLNKATSSSLALESWNKDNSFVHLPESDNPIVTRLNNEINTLAQIQELENNLVTSIDNFILKTNTFLLESYYENNTSHSAYNFNEALKNLESLRKKLDQLNIKIQKKMNSYLEFYKTNSTILNKKYKKEANSRKDKYLGLLASNQKIKETINAEKSIEILKSLVFLNKENQYKSLPIQFMGDQAKIQLKIEPFKPEFMKPTFLMPLTLPIENENYWSVGVSFYGTFLHDQYFSNIGVPVNDSTKVYSLVKESNPNYEVGIATLLRFGKKLDIKDQYIGAHGTIGPGFSMTEKVRTRLLLGGGLSFGRKHSVSVDIGFIVGHVFRKSNAFELETDYSVKPENVTVSELMCNGFLSFGYLYKL